jgi:hypothetical protein
MERTREREKKKDSSEWLNPPLPSAPIVLLLPKHHPQHLQQLPNFSLTRQTRQSRQSSAYPALLSRRRSAHPRHFYLFGTSTIPKPLHLPFSPSKLPHSPSFIIACFQIKLLCCAEFGDDYSVFTINRYTIHCSPGIRIVLSLRSPDSPRCGLAGLCAGHLSPSPIPVG